MPTIAERILRALNAFGPLDDDVLAARLGVVRQSVNQTARRLEAQGKLRRYVGREGKIVNSLLDGTDGYTPPPQQSAPPIELNSGDVITEDEVKTAVRDHLKAKGYDVTVAWGGTRGIDIDARRPGHRVVIEAKGQVRTLGAQQVNYFLGAIGELIQRMNDPGATYGLAFPGHKQYRGLVDRLPALARNRLGLVVYFVSRNRDGLTVEENHG